MTSRESAVTMPATAHSRPYLIQWERALRWRARAEAAIAANDDPLDFLLVLFESIFQMRDWLCAARPDLRQATFECFARSGDLALVRDIANGYKHMMTSRYTIDGRASPAREYLGEGRVGYVVPRFPEANKEALVIADSGIAEICRFMQRNGLL